MKARFNYKSRKTIIITIAIIALLALSATGIYVFTKGNDRAEAFSESNTMIEGSSTTEGTQENPEEGQTVEPNVDIENEGEDTTGETPNIQGTATTEGTTNGEGTTTTTTGNVPNQEYVTERQEEVETLVYEGYLVGWTPISLTALTDDIDLNKAKQELSYTVEKVATLINGQSVTRDENGEMTAKVQPGDKVTYAITVKNTGNVTLQNVKVSDELVKYEETIQVLAIGDQKEITVEYIVDQSDMNENEEIVNTVKVTVPDSTDSEKEENDEEVIPVNPYITVSGSKAWVDYNNQENTRPENVTIEVLNGEEVVDTITVNAQEGNTWNYTSKELPKYNSNNEAITYTVREANVDTDYTASVEGTTITNTLKDVPMVTVSGSKVWVDYNNQENTRPENVTIEVLNGEEAVDTITVNAQEGNTWSYTSKELPKYNSNNEAITYTVREANVDTDYTASVEGTTVTNTLKEIPKTQMTVSKVWVDGNNQDANRPSSVKVQLFVNGVSQGDVVTLTEANEIQADANIWQYTFTDLDKYNSNNEAISYEVKEVISRGNAIENNGTNGDYTVTYQKDIENRLMTITNSYTPKTTSVTATKVWADNNNEDGDRPSSVTIKLYNGSTAVDVTPVVSENGNTWTYTFNNLPMYDAGKLITYTAKELRTDGTIVANNDEYDDNYVTTYNKNTITNTHVKPIITVNKAVDKTQVAYGDTITYTLTAKNSGTKDGVVTIKDTIPTGTELAGDINVTVNGTTTTIDYETQLKPGYEVSLAKQGGTATITFRVMIKAYAGETITNTGYYKVGNNPETPITQETETVQSSVETETTVIPTITTVTPVTVPQKAILVLDLSGSMDDEIVVDRFWGFPIYKSRLELMQSAVNTFLTNFLDGENQVMIITYSSDATKVCDFTTSKDTAYNSIRYADADGGTNIDAGLTLANQYITASNASTTSVILMTDGLPGRHIDNTTGENIRVSDGNSYNATAGNAAIESAGWIKAKGSKVYSIGFGLEGQSGATMLQRIATPTKYNEDGTVNTNYYYGTFDGAALETAFRNIVTSITTTSDSDPIELDTASGIVTITSGFAEGQNVEIYTGIYNKDTSVPVATYTWTQFIALDYTTYSSNQITFNLGKYMKDNSIAANADVSIRFVDQETAE